MSKYEELSKLKELFDSGVLTQEEYDVQKQKTLAQTDVSINSAENSVVNDEPSGVISALSFFFPIVGLILYLVWLNSFSTKAKRAGLFALVGFAINVVIGLISVFAVGCGDTRWA
jgi:hypothetical protein